MRKAPRRPAGAKLSTCPLRTRTSSSRSYPRTVLITWVRERTSAWRILHSVLRSRERAERKCTVGRSMRLDTSLSTCASRLSVFSRRAPTPTVRTRLPGTTRTSWPARCAAAATAYDAAHVSITTRLGPRPASTCPSSGVA